MSGVFLKPKVAGQLASRADILKGRFPLHDTQVSVALIKLTVNYATLAMLSLVDASRPCRSVYRPYAGFCQADKEG